MKVEDNDSFLVPWLRTRHNCPTVGLSVFCSFE